MAEARPLPRDMAELRRRIDRDWAALGALLAPLSAARLTTPTDEQGWSIKDHLAHLTAWERSIVSLLRGRPRHEGLRVDAATYQGGDFDVINAAIHEQSKDRPVADVLADFHATHGHLLAALASLTDADLARTYSSYLPDEPGEESGAPIVGWIEGNAHDHYREHMAWIERLLG